jgi:hypothetical protein
MVSKQSESIMRITRHLAIAILFVFASECHAQSDGKSGVGNSLRQKVNSILTARYYRKDAIDTAYITRPRTKWTVTARLNVSGADINTEGIDNGHHFKSEMKADYKSTLSLGVSYLGFTLSAALNPAKLIGKYRDYELNFNSYGRRFGFDIIYQDAHNFTGWHDTEGMERIELPADILSVKTLNLNAFYVFNRRRFSYPAAFSQSYIQKQSAGSFLLGLSGQWQYATVDAQQFESQYKAITIGIGAGYGYNWVPGRNWLVHLSALPTFCLVSHKTLLVNNEDVPFKYHFPEVIITGRRAVVRQFGNWFAGTSMQYNFNNVGDKNKLAVNNQKWLARLFVGCRF